jgi:hypothetical protein
MVVTPVMKMSDHLVRQIQLLGAGMTNSLTGAAIGAARSMGWLGMTAHPLAQIVDAHLPTIDSFFTYSEATGYYSSAGHRHLHQSSVVER